jgi:glycosyltransferase involved in cell wall biosynthesis
MLPTYEPDDKLARALESVLSQALPAHEMQITVVDDGSQPGLVRELVEQIDLAGRVEIIEQPRRLGLGGNWNRALGLARGELVHLLHQDDYVLPGFYDRMERAFRQQPGVGMAFCRTRLVDAHDRPIRTTSRQQWMSGVLANWLPRIAERQRIQTPSAVVARRTYESLGGFRTDLKLALDWEMWVRIAARFPVWYEPRPLAAYRRHADNETSRLHASGAAWPDLARAIRSTPSRCRRRFAARRSRPASVGTSPRRSERPSGRSGRGTSPRLPSRSARCRRFSACSTSNSAA